MTQSESRGQATFLQRYSMAFGRRQAFLMKIVGFQEPEVTAHGAFVVDASGRSWLDLGSFGVHMLGHQNASIVNAAQQALVQMGLSTKILPNRAALECAEQLIQYANDRVDSVLFYNSGAEAVECAVRLAYASTGRKKFGALQGAFHGRTLAAAALSDQSRRTSSGIGNLDVVRFSADRADAAYSAIESTELAGVFIECIQGEGGINELPHDFLRGLQNACAHSGTIFIVDEIQSGLGRTKEKFAYNHLGLSADILLVGKALGGGLVPISASLFDSKAIGSSAANPVVNSSSFAGGGLAATIAKAVLSEVESPSFQLAVARLEAQFLGGLALIKTRTRGIVEVRGRGLMLGVEFENAEFCGEVLLELVKRDVLVTFCLSMPQVMRIYPPSVLSQHDAAGFLVDFEEAVRATSEMQTTVFP